MPPQDPTNRLSIVELAMARNAKQNNESDCPPAEPAVIKRSRSAGRRTYDEALSRHLNKLRPVKLEGNPPTTESSHPGKPALPTVKRAESNRLLFVTGHLLSAAAGAALTWHVMNEPVRTPPPQPIMTVKPITAITPSTPVLAPTPAPTVIPVDDQVRDMLEHWRQAWSSRDVAAYLGFYSTDFVPADGTAQSAWAEARRKNFLGRTQINVGIHNVTIDPIDNDRVKVLLQQDYASGSYKETRQPKTFLLNREGKEWKIVGEWQGQRLHLPAIQK